MKNSLHYLFMTNYLSFQKELMSNLKDTDLTSGQPKVLEYLLHNDGALQKDIAQACYIEPATLTALLAGMENKGLIVRKNLNGNRRSLYVYLSDKGISLANKVTLSFDKIETDALNGFSSADKEQLIDLLLRINQNIYGKGVVSDE